MMFPEIIRNSKHLLLLLHYISELDSTSLTGTITKSVMQCTASDLGEPEAQLYVKVKSSLISIQGNQY
jgi:hypothetical protein